MIYRARNSECVAIAQNRRRQSLHRNGRIKIMLKSNSSGVDCLEGLKSRLSQARQRIGSVLHTSIEDSSFGILLQILFYKKVTSIGFFPDIKKLFTNPRRRNRIQETFERVTSAAAGNQFPSSTSTGAQYQTAGGNWSTLYYARFRDSKGKQRMFPLGSKIEDARKTLTIYQARNY